MTGLFQFETCSGRLPGTPYNSRCSSHTGIDNEAASSMTHVAEDDETQRCGDFKQTISKARQEETTKYWLEDFLSMQVLRVVALPLRTKQGAHVNTIRNTQASTHARASSSKQHKRTHGNTQAESATAKEPSSKRVRRSDSAATKTWRSTVTQANREGSSSNPSGGKHLLTFASGNLLASRNLLHMFWVTLVQPCPASRVWRLQVDYLQSKARRDDKILARGLPKLQQSRNDHKNLKEVRLVDRICNQKNAKRNLQELSETIKPQRYREYDLAHLKLVFEFSIYNVWKSVQYGVSNGLDTAYWGFLVVVLPEYSHTISSIQRIESLWIQRIAL
ncbi:hypothetical protein Tco_0939172 [Tanacetum coccineum]|uniref:Uncharacterized protein n=1 Tax=Tanacetum coccineum TaxID=301880 RepID=A0ABQ5DK53_9ASTR